MKIFWRFAPLNFISHDYVWVYDYVLRSISLAMSEEIVHSSLLWSVTSEERDCIT